MSAHKAQLRLNSNSWYDQIELAEVITIQEASVLWGKSRTAIMYYFNRGTIAGRRSVSGGTILVLTKDCWRVWGAPSVNALTVCFDGETEVLDKFLSDMSDERMNYVKG